MMTYRCPSDHTERPPKHAALSNYALCYGDGVQGVGEDVKSISQRGVFANGRARAFRDIHDGLVNTLMMAEVLTDNGTRRSTSVIAANIAGLQDDPSKCLATVDSRGAYLPNIQLRRTPDGLAARGGNWADGAIMWSGFNTILPPNSPNCDISSSITANPRLEGVFSASSAHQGGCHVLMADGAVKFITTSIDFGNLQTPSVYPGSPTPKTIDSPYGVWGALGTIGRDLTEVESTELEE
jgi:prepilin-type processing-associated H-X9-DG protein